MKNLEEEILNLQQEKTVFKQSNLDKLWIWLNHLRENHDLETYLNTTIKNQAKEYEDQIRVFLNKIKF